MSRLPSWERNLQEYLSTINLFEWGKTDCCMFAVGAVKAITGIDHGTEYKHRTKLGAAKLLTKHGGVEAIAIKHLGNPKPATFAQRGDVVSFQTDEGLALGICIGTKIAAMKAEGLIFLPLFKSLKAWSV